MGKNASKDRPPRGSSPSGKRLQKPCKDHLKGTCTKSSCDYGILLCVIIANHTQASSLARSVRSCTEIDRQPKRAKKGDRERYFRFLNSSRRKPTAFYGKAPFFETKKSVFEIRQKHHSPRKDGKNTIIRSGSAHSLTLPNAAHLLQNLRIGLRKRFQDNEPSDV